MTVVHFDPFSGASGDMVLGALLDGGLDFAHLESELAKLGLGGYRLELETVEKHGVRGTRITVETEEEHHHRTWRDIQHLIRLSDLPEPTKVRALAIFLRLAEAESAAHGVAVGDVHFHEVGAVDSIVDICGAAIGLEALGVTVATCGPVRVGTGFVKSQHGLMPVPAPATAHLLAAGRVPMAPMPPACPDVQAELLTPTGAAILVSTCSFAPVDVLPRRVAHGFGSMELPWPNALRIWILGSEDSEPSKQGTQIKQLQVIETNIDDMNPQGYELLMERVFAAGAFDCWLTPIQMKKARPAVTISVLCSQDRREAIEDLLFENTPTLGVRAHGVDRRALERLELAVATRFGDVRLKLAVRDGRISQARPEYDDCARLARQTGRSFSDIWDDALRLGERYVGQQSGSISE